MGFTLTFVLKRSISRARDTAGYKVLTVRDGTGRKVAGAMGGGYDMIGTVLGATIVRLFPDGVTGLAEKRAHLVFHADRGATTSGAPDSLYGLSYSDETGKGGIDGGCGVSSVERIAEALDVAVHWVCDRKGTKTGFVLVAGPTWSNLTEVNQ